MLEILVVARYQSDSPVASTRRDPYIGCPHRSPCLETLRRNISPMLAGGFVRKKRGIERYKIFQKRTPLSAPVVPDGSNRQFRQGHETDHQMVAHSDAVRFPVERMSRLEQNRDRVGIEKEIRHRECEGWSPEAGIRRRSRTNAIKSSASSGCSTSCDENRFTGGFSCGIGVCARGVSRWSLTIVATI